MNVISSGRRAQQLIHNDKVLGELLYKNVFYMSATIRLSGVQDYIIRQSNFLGTGITVTQGDHGIANLKMNWRGRMIISFHDGREYTFKSVGLFQSKYVLIDRHSEKIFEIHPHFKWRKFRYNYSLDPENGSDDVLLILLSVYAANYSIAVMSGAASGIS